MEVKLTALFLSPALRRASLAEEISLPPVHVNVHLLIAFRMILSTNLVPQHEAWLHFATASSRLLLLPSFSPLWARPLCLGHLVIDWINGL